MLSHSNKSIHAIQDPSQYYFAKNNGRVIQNDDKSEDFEGALLNSYFRSDNLVKGVETIIERFSYATLLIKKLNGFCMQHF